MPSGSPVPLVPQKMKNFDEVAKGLGGFVNLWDTMVNEDISGEFRRQNKPLSYYWRAITSAIDATISVLRTLQNGFWLSSRFAPTVEDKYIDDDTVRKEYAKDALFVGHRHDHPPPSFRVGRDIYVGYFLAVQSTNGNLRPFWVACIVSNPSPDPDHRDQIQIQYWRPNSFQHVDANTYVGWDSREGNVWCEDKSFLPSWSHTDCVMTAWKSRVRSRTIDPKMKIPIRQISIINVSLEAFESHSDGACLLKQMVHKHLPSVIPKVVAMVIVRYVSLFRLQSLLLS